MTGTVPIVKIVTKFKPRLPSKHMTKRTPLLVVRMVSQRVRAPSYCCTTLTIKNLVSRLIHALILHASDLLAIINDILSVHGFHCALLNNISLVDLSHFSQVSHSFLRMITSNMTSQLNLSYQQKKHIHQTDI